jgi:hypothetical protein
MKFEEAIAATKRATGEMTACSIPDYLRGAAI